MGVTGGGVRMKPHAWDTAETGNDSYKGGKKRNI